MAMTLDDYRHDVKNDIKSWLDEHDAWPTAEKGTDEYDRSYEYIYEHLWVADSVTGNASGSYTFNAWQAEDNVSHLIWDEDLWNLLGELGTTADEAMPKGAEFVDLSIRCALLSECLGKVLDEAEDEDDESSED